MANNSALKQDIRDYIYTNHNEEITGNILRDVLLEMVDTLGAGWVYKGVAALNTSPGTPDTNVFYLATVPGTYQYFKNSSNVSLTVSDGEVAIFKIGSDGSWSKDTTGAATSAKLTELGQRIGRVEIPITESGKGLPTNGATIGNPSAYYSTMSYMRYPVSEGDVVIVNGVGGNAPRLWAFADSSHNIISNSEINVSASNLRLTAPIGAAEVIINTSDTSKPSYVEAKNSAWKKIDENALGISALIANSYISWGLVWDNRISNGKFLAIEFTLSGYSSSTSVQVKIPSGLKVTTRDSDIKYLTEDVNLSLSGMGLSFLYYDTQFHLSGNGTDVQGKTLVAIIDRQWATEPYVSVYTPSVYYLNGKLYNEPFSRSIFPDNAFKVSVFCANDGDDANDGMSEDSAVKTLSRAKQVLDSITSKKDLRLKCGSVFFEKSAFEVFGFDLLSYGGGSRPIITHFLPLSISSSFTKDNQHGDDIWCIDLSSAPFGGAGYDSENGSIGFVYEPNTDTIVFGNKVNGFTEDEIDNPSGVYAATYLQEDGDFLQRGDMLYFKWSGNPNNDFSELYFSPDGTILSVNNCKVSNIKIMGCGYGITKSSGERKNISIYDVQIDMIGGSSKNDGAQNYYRQGNGVEFWISRVSPQNIDIRECRLSRIFDAALTIQGRYEMTAEETEQGHPVLSAEHPQNVLFEGNTIIKCRQAYECFSRLLDNNGDFVSDYPLINCSFRNNRCVGCGDNGFGCLKEKRDCNLLSGADGMAIEGNIFFGGGAYYRNGMFNSEVGTFDFLPGNVFYIKQGQLLYNISSSVSYVFPVQNDQSTWPDGASDFANAVELRIAEYRTATGDIFSKFIEITDEDVVFYGPIIKS